MAWDVSGVNSPSGVAAHVGGGAGGGKPRHAPRYIFPPTSSHTGTCVNCPSILHGGLLDVALKLNPYDAYVPNNMGHNCHMRGRWAEAIQWYEQALALDPTIEQFGHLAHSRERLAAIAQESATPNKQTSPSAGVQPATAKVDATKSAAEPARKRWWQFWK